MTTPAATSHPGYRIERARAEHAQAIGDVVEDAYRGAGLLEEEGGADPYVDEIRDLATRLRHSVVLVALDDQDRVLGSIGVVPSGTPITEDARPGEVELRMLGVAPAARGRGVATALLAACTPVARDLGAEAIVLLSVEEPAAVARRYPRLGYARWPERDHHWDEEAVRAGEVEPYPVWGKRLV